MFAYLCICKVGKRGEKREQQGLRFQVDKDKFNSTWEIKKNCNVHTHIHTHLRKRIQLNYKEDMIEYFVTLKLNKIWPVI